MRKLPEDIEAERSFGEWTCKARDLTCLRGMSVSYLRVSMAQRERMRWASFRLIVVYGGRDAVVEADAPARLHERWEASHSNGNEADDSRHRSAMESSKT
jgi:hypothetical protein